MMLLDILFSLSAIAMLLIVTETLWRTKKLQIETSRKIVHIGTGIIIAFWPYFLNWTIIQLLSLALLVVIFISYRFNIFRSIHSIERLTIGEVLYPVGIGLCALLEPAPYIFTIAILHLTLADGLAAIVGIKYGTKNRYTILSHGKSLAGSLTFFAVSFIIFTVAAIALDQTIVSANYAYFLIAALTLTVVENISWYGLDDITVPVAAVVIATLIS